MKKQFSSLNLYIKASNKGETVSLQFGNSFLAAICHIKKNFRVCK